MSLLRNIIKKEQFNPQVIGVFTNPFYFSRRALFHSMMELKQELSGTLLDIGCGSKPYEPYLSVIKYIGLEIDNKQSRANSKADVFYDGKQIPFPDGKFDSILANEVFEHVFNPKEFLSEINRVLKINGVFLLTVPFVWDEHEQPNDYARYTSFGLRHILEQNGFSIVIQKKSVTDTQVIFQLINEYIYKITYVNNVVLRQLLNVIFISPCTIFGIFLSKFLPSNTDLYLDNIILARKVKNV